MFACASAPSLPGSPLWPCTCCKRTGCPHLPRSSNNADKYLMILTFFTRPPSAVLNLFSCHFGNHCSKPMKRSTTFRLVEKISLQLIEYLESVLIISFCLFTGAVSRARMIAYEISSSTSWFITRGEDVQSVQHDY